MAVCGIELVCHVCGRALKDVRDCADRVRQDSRDQAEVEVSTVYDHNNRV